MKKIVVIGCKGMAGHIVNDYLESLGTYDVYGIARGVEREKNLINLDVTNIRELENILKINSFDVVVNCIGILNETAEENPELAIWLNSYFPHYLSSLGREYKFKFIHISTDCVFSGKEGGYTVESFKNGVGYYAQSKALGEVINTSDLTFRTSIIGPELKQNGIGLFHWFMNQKDEISGFTEVFWSGVTTLELAKAINESITQELTGLYQLVYNTKISKYDLINEFNNIFRNNGVIVNQNSNYISDKSMINSRTDFNYTVPDYSTMVKEMKEWMLNYKELYKHYNLMNNYKS